MRTAERLSTKVSSHLNPVMTKIIFQVESISQNAHQRFISRGPFQILLRHLFRLPQWRMLSPKRKSRSLKRRLLKNSNWKMKISQLTCKTIHLSYKIISNRIFGWAITGENSIKPSTSPNWKLTSKTKNVAKRDNWSKRKRPGKSDNRNSHSGTIFAKEGPSLLKSTLSSSDAKNQFNYCSEILYSAWSASKHMQIQ